MQRSISWAALTLVAVGALFGLSRVDGATPVVYGDTGTVPPSDLTGPQLRSLTFTPSLVTTVAVAQPITITVRMTDDLAGVATGLLVIDSPSGNTAQKFEPNFHAVDRISGDELDGIYQVVITIPRFAETGTWRVRQFSLWDSANNLRFLDRQAIIDLGFGSEFVNNVASPEPRRYFLPRVGKRGS